MTIERILIKLVALILVLEASGNLPGATISVGVVNEHLCTVSDESVCTTKCHDVVSIKFQKPVFLKTFGVLNAIVKNSGTAQDHLCYFTTKVEFEGEKQELNVNKVEIDNMKILGIQKPADTVTLTSVCSNGEACVFTVSEPNIDNWSILRTELCGPGEQVLNTTCADCPSNHYSDTYQAPECKECQAGFTSRERASACSFLAVV
ncbi:hypothetical protein ACHWQZ_G014468 [Mnemiopsis leidyi]